MTNTRHTKVDITDENCGNFSTYCCGWKESGEEHRTSVDRYYHEEIKAHTVENEITMMEGCLNLCISSFDLLRHLRHSRWSWRVTIAACELIDVRRNTEQEHQRQDNLQAHIDSWAKFVPIVKYPHGCSTSEGTDCPLDQRTIFKDRGVVHHV